MTAPSWWDEPMESADPADVRKSRIPAPAPNYGESAANSCPDCHGTGIISRPHIGDLRVNWACGCREGVNEDE
jgi:hypothetical protein